MTDREARITAFLAAHGWGGAQRRILADDASFRRYERICQGERRAVLMDAPPEKEDVRPFLKIAEILLQLNLSAPAILAQDTALGFLLLEDLGDDTYTRLLAADSKKEDTLYLLAVDLLIALHRGYKAEPDIPAYDDALLMTEANLLLEWYLPAITGEAAPEPVRREYAALWQALFSQAKHVPGTLVLRDYHVDNLIWLPRREGTSACGLLDFQDAVLGPVTYDLVSLLEDARRDVPTALAERGIERYLAAFPEIDPAAFHLSYAILGAQRSAKILGIFTRLDRRDGKPDYLCHLPRVWRWLERDLTHPALSGIRDWFDRVLPPAYRAIPQQATKT
jgi:aminoglycoside/choline kinase family phosphotransferase